MIKAPLHIAKEQEVAALGFTTVPEDQLKEKTQEKMQEILDSLRSVQSMLDVCTKCGNCVKQCHSYLGTEDYHNIPAARADLMRSLYKRYFTFAGKLLGRYTGAEEFDADTLSK